MDWQIIGHEWAAQILQKHIQQNSVRHAYLFSGAPGIGRRSLAVRFAQAINCIQPPEPGLPCGTCRLCKQIEKGQQADLSIVQSEEDSSNIKVDQIRELQRSLSLSPYEAKYRIAILKNFQEANASAQNALLKTLEEAPDKVILFLTVDSVENLLPTIVSRCEILRLRPMPVETLYQTLQELWHVETDLAFELAHLTNGRIGLAHQYMVDPESLEQLHIWLEDSFELLRQGNQDRFNYAEKITDRRKKSNTKENLRTIYITWLNLWRDIFLTAGGSEMPLTYVQFNGLTRQVANQITLEEALAQMQRLEMALDQLNANLNQRLLTENILYHWPRVN
ncbi:MAG: DNA polymerase III subunit delta' [Anaerolineaceae bacterium]|nr:DNA polymerase III subunit delta' [Anaerolineaceae bacterium]